MPKTNSRSTSNPPFISQDDDRLATCWIKVTKLFQSRADKDTFWPTLTVVYNAGSDLARDAISLQQRWEKIHKDTLNFSAYYQALKASPPTGRSEHELITEAKDRFKSRHGRKFGFVCLWQRTLRHEAQWMITEPNFGQIDDEEAEDSDLSSDTTEEEAYDEEAEDSDLSSDSTEEEALDQGGRNTTRSSKVRGREQYHSDSEDGDGYADDMHDAENERKRLNPQISHGDPPPSVFLIFRPEPSSLFSSG
ncbi:hypothetical protein PtA15_13A340 [Puccinia triticina]|uniref:No apical meristem-associated C-terminal domain-containing protein n=1 Tax=Puccinia triticina TaxID=208348 RepID=A0ABY7D120_9BASI|nr:uncharacterized protein PtA15_13A340 [Puccinia triticina]WAQ90940.1 hypothetical protein PtA15_13A340 [Puccinia triticina]